MGYRSEDDIELFNILLKCLNGYLDPPTPTYCLCYTENDSRIPAELYTQLLNKELDYQGGHS